MAAANSPKKHPRRFDSPQQEAFLSLWRTYDRLRMLEDELFSQHDLTAQQYNALRQCRQCQLSACCGESSTARPRVRERSNRQTRAERYVQVDCSETPNLPVTEHRRPLIC
jgi:hypothetical protein